MKKAIVCGLGGVVAGMCCGVIFVGRGICWGVLKYGTKEEIEAFRRILIKGKEAGKA